MHVFQQIEDLRSELSGIYRLGQSVGLVPTMGALHNGHASLMEASVADNDHTVATIFVNPTQFGPGEDLDTYPRTLEADLELCRSRGVTHVFTPTEAVMYPEGRSTFEVQLGLRSLDRIMDGAKRPGHFNGVLQVVSKLFNIVQPTRAYFGLKDFQQITILKTLVRELFFPLTIVECPIVREPDGLAMSSRNRYLNEEERQQARFLSQALTQAKAASQAGASTADLSRIVQELLADYPIIKLDYFEVRSGQDLRLLETLQPEDDPVGLIAAFCGPARLIDNMRLL